MAQISVADPAPSNTFPFGRGTSMVQGHAAKKRKTPSELRGEQMKRKGTAKMPEFLHPIQETDGKGGTIQGLKKSEPYKAPKYIDTRVDAVFPVRKSSDMFNTLYGKEKAKAPTYPSAGCSSVIGSESQRPCTISSEKTKSANEAEGLRTSAINKPEECSHRLEKCSQTTFRTVAELSLEKERLSGPAMIDMDKALKGLVVREHTSTSHLNGDLPGISSDIPSVSSTHGFSETIILGGKSPLDFTLKSEVRFVSSSSMSWSHRLSTSSALTMIPQFTSQFSVLQNQSGGDSLCYSSTADVLYARALQSWVYPESSLPASFISAMNLSAARGETDFMLRRQLAWEDSFRSLYYMLRKKLSDIFYLCTSHFVVMFVGLNLDNGKRSCHAYLSRSTRGLRSLLREHDINFSMPLCHSKVEEATADDLVELSEIEKHNLGQTRRQDSMSEIDNSSQSLLAFTGNDSVHSLYDFLINYRSFLSFLTTTDVPVLYSPVPFQNSSLHAPEVKCKEMKKAEAIFSPFNSVPIEKGGQEIQGSSTSICYSIEIKDTILPPWTVAGLCAAMVSRNISFEASFVLESVSAGLNAALDAISQKAPTESGNDFLLSKSNLGNAEAVVVPCLRAASVKSLKYTSGSYKASLLRL